MKAFLLAAGLGTRLRPLTDKTPKCMLPINGKPLIDIWLESLQRAGADEILVNLHWLPDVVRGHLQRRTSPAVRTVFEPILLGSAGTLMANRGWVEGEEKFLVCYADNLTDFDVASLVEFHVAKKSVATLALFHTENPSACGIVEVDHSGRVVSFVEKPDNPTSDLANAGVYVLHPSALDVLSGPPPKDIGYDLLPPLVGRAYAMPLNGYLRDIGTPESYDRAQREWRQMEATR